jgi:hypothetical protein
LAVAVLGLPSDDRHKKLVAEITERFDYFEKQLQSVRQSMSRYTRLYLGQRKDERRETERWRSKSWMGDPFHQTQTEVAVWLSLLNAQTPPFAPEAVGTEDEGKARAFVRAIDYFQRRTSWQAVQEKALLKNSYQGWTVIETRWQERKRTITAPPTMKERIAYDEKVNEAMRQGMPEPPKPLNDPMGSQLWHEQARIQPLAIGPREIVQYRGPAWISNSDYDYFFDPYVEDWSQHELFIKRVIKPWKWLEARAGTDPADGSRPYDEENLKLCKGKSSGDSQRLSQWDREISAQAGLTFDPNDPLYTDSAELLECWRTGDDLPYLVLCNRAGVINHHPEIHPYWHGELPFTIIRNVWQPLLGIGLSSYAQLEQSFADRLKFRDLLFDMLVLSVMPMFLKKRSLGLADAQRALQPGVILDVNDTEGFKRAWEAPAGFAQLIQVGQMILNDENLLLSTGENVRGQAATVGRVSATEAQSRLTQALVRHQQRAIRLEEEHSPILPQGLALVTQKWPQDDPDMASLRANLVGLDEQDPWGEYPAKDTFIEALTMDIRFNGASRSKDLALAAQQLKDFTQFGASVQVAPGVPALTGIEIRNLMRRQYRTLGLKGTEEALTKEGDAMIEQLVQLSLQNAGKNLQLQSANADMQMQSLQNPQPPPAAPGPEATIVYKDTPPDVQRQLEERAGLQPSQMGELQVMEKMAKAMPKPSPMGGNGQEGPPRG